MRAFPRVRFLACRDDGIRYSLEFRFSQSPVFQAAESAVTYMVRSVARRMGDTYKRSMKAFVYQKLHVGVAIFRR